MTDTDLCGEREEPPEADEIHSWLYCDVINLFSKHKSLERLGLVNPMNVESSSETAILWMEGETLASNEL
jgi:hypothetical protein